jgi:ankyrin repeat protein
LSIYLTVAIHISYFSFVDIIIKMSKLILSYLFKTNLASFRSAIINDDTDRICRTLDIERDFLNKNIDGEGNTALLLAIEYASPLTVRLLLEQGAHPDQPNTITFQTPLGFIASKVYEDYNSYKAQRTLEMAKILLDHGAYVDKPSPRNYKDENNKDYSGKETPLMTAVRKRNLPIVKLFIERKANVNYVERQSQIRA